MPLNRHHFSSFICPSHKRVFSPCAYILCFAPLSLYVCVARTRLLVLVHRIRLCRQLRRPFCAANEPFRRARIATLRVVSRTTHLLRNAIRLCSIQAGVFKSMYLYNLYIINFFYRYVYAFICFTFQSSMRIITFRFLICCKYVFCFVMILNLCIYRWFAFFSW